MSACYLIQPFDLCGFQPMLVNHFSQQVLDGNQMQQSDEMHLGKLISTRIPNLWTKAYSEGYTFAADDHCCYLFHGKVLFL